MLAVSDTVTPSRYGAEVLRGVVEQHAEDAAFLWEMRCGAVESLDTVLPALARLDERVEANLDGLRIAGEAGFRLALAATERGELGEVFAAAVLALESGRAERVRRLIDRAAPWDMARGLGGALGWLPTRCVGPALDALGTLRTLAVRRANLIARLAHRLEDAASLDLALSDTDPRLRALACRAIGELGRRERMAALENAMREQDAEIRFWAARSAAIFGNGAALPVLRELAESGGVEAEAASELASSLVPPADARAWIATLQTRASLRRVAIRAVAALGEPSAVPWLLDLIAVPEQARLAGWAVTSISGAMIEGDLVGDAPAGFSAGPSDDIDDDDVSPDPDAELSWPRAATLAARWVRSRDSFETGVRYVLGRPRNDASLHETLGAGRQSERALAAFELARAGETFFDVLAPASRQLESLPAALSVSVGALGTGR